MSQQHRNIQKQFQESGILYVKVADLDIKKQRQSTLSLFPNLTKSISMKKHLNYSNSTLQKYGVF
jgi:dimeric dUTPase (all-alpha-NTP-PPase superfamily)